ncbi:hypothetical protein QVD17_04349 [Tagetes erecta]|uniref:Transmembrane protein n=1 Tax=Tagetes erecta TaxID=13708 RepID=A0AAD8P498_TARER|nr:hypothetical protein QVD17_04349 [Tagetes erecta]
MVWSKVHVLISLLLFLLLVVLDVFSGGDGFGFGFGFVEGAFGKSEGVVNGGGYSSQSNVGLAIAVTVMAGIAVAATLVYSNRYKEDNVCS